jgi:hypothetical protein
LKRDFEQNGASLIQAGQGTEPAILVEGAARSFKIKMYWSAGISPASVLRFSSGRLLELGINADVPRAGKMPALQTLLAHVLVPRAGKMPALQSNANCCRCA